MGSSRNLIIAIVVGFQASLGLAQEHTPAKCLGELRNQVVFDLQVQAQEYIAARAAKLSDVKLQQLRYSRILLAIMNALELKKITPTSTPLRPPYSNFPTLQKLTLDERVTVSEILNDASAFGGREALAETAMAQYQKVIFESPELAFFRTPNASDFQQATGDYLSAIFHQARLIQKVDENSNAARALTVFQGSVETANRSKPDCTDPLREQTEKYISFTQSRPLSLKTSSAAAGACALMIAFTDVFTGILCIAPASIALGYSLNIALEGNQEQDILATALISRQMPRTQDSQAQNLLRYRAFAESALLSLGIPRRSGPI